MDWKEGSTTSDEGGTQQGVREQLQSCRFYKGIFFFQNATRQWKWRDSLQRASGNGEFLCVQTATPANLPLPSLPTKTLACALLCLELASLTGYSPCMAKSPMGPATPCHVYGHSKLANGIGGLLLHACILRRKKIHVEKTFKTISFGELVCKSAPLGQFAPSCWLPLIQLKDEEGQPLGVSISNLLIANSSSDLPVRK